jgi:hypothetical protein
MLNALDKASVILRAHLILEEFLNIWCSRLTQTDDLFAGTFVPYKTKLVVAQNLGLDKDYENILDKFNEIRNRYSHRRKYALETRDRHQTRQFVSKCPVWHTLTAG